MTVTICFLLGIVVIVMLTLLWPVALCRYCEEEEQTGADGLCSLCRKIKNAIEEEESHGN